MKSIVSFPAWRGFVPALCLLWAFSPALAQVPAAGPSSVLVKVPVCVADRNGAPGLNLSAADFTVKLNGAPFVVERFAGSESPIVIVLALDTTGNRQYIDTLRKELVNFVQALPPYVQLMILTMNDGVKILQANTGDKALLTKAVADYPTVGHSGFLDNVEAVAQFSDRLWRSYRVRVATLIATDSDITLYRHKYTTADFSTAVDRLKDSLDNYSAPLFILRLPVTPLDRVTGAVPAGSPGFASDRAYSSLQDGVIRTDTVTADGAPIVAQTKRFQSEVPNRTYEGAVQAIADRSGGRAEFPLDLQGVSPSLAALLRRIHASYALEGRVAPAENAAAAGGADRDEALKVEVAVKCPAAAESSLKAFSPALVRAGKPASTLP